MLEGEPTAVIEPINPMAWTALATDKTMIVTIRIETRKAFFRLLINIPRLTLAAK